MGQPQGLSLNMNKGDIMREKKIEQYDVVIIGGGPAGLSAGIYAGRANLKTLIIEQNLVGGLAVNMNEIENYPGFPEGMTGKALMDLFYQQAKRFNVHFRFTDVRKVDIQGDVKKIWTFRDTYETRVVIIASGGKPKVTGAKNEDKYLGKGITFCSVCDAAVNTGKKVVVIGSEDMAVEESLFLAKFADKVILSVNVDSDKMNCSEELKDVALNNPKIEILWNTSVNHFEGNNQLEKVVLKNLKTNELIKVDCRSCFEFIGYIPNADLFKGMVDMTENGYIITNENMQTNIEGVYAIGDIRNKFLRQVVTCAGDGAIASIHAEKYLLRNKAFKNKRMKVEKPSITLIYNSIEEDQLKLLKIIEKMELKLKGRYFFYTIDIYKAKGFLAKSGIEKVPTVIVSKNEIEKKLSDHITEEKITRIAEKL